MFSRRTTLTVLSLLVVLATLAACAPPTPVVVEKEVIVEKPVVETVEVVKEVVVEKLVVETVEVVKEVVVEKPVEVTKIVEKPVEVTPPPKVTVTLAYNRFFTMSFGPAPPPLDFLREYLKEKYPEIELQFNLVPDSTSAYHDAAMVWLSSKDPTIDILGIDAPWVMEFAEAGYLMPITDRLIPEMKEDLDPALLDVYSYEGERYGIPWWGSVHGLYYRKDILEEYGFDPPATYDDLVEICETILADHPEMSGFTWTGGMSEDLVCAWIDFFKGFGGEYWDEEGKCAINSPEGVAALEFMVDLIGRDITPREVTAWTGKEAKVRFVEGKTIFHVSWQDMVTWLDNPEKSQIVDKWGYMPNPAQPGGRHTGTWGGWAFAINAYTDVPEEAWKVLEAIGSYEVQKDFIISQGPVQPHKKIYTDPEVLEATPKMDVIEEVLPTAYDRPKVPEYWKVSTILKEELHSALTGLKSPKAALDDACVRIDEAIAEAQE